MGFLRGSEPEVGKEGSLGKEAKKDSSGRGKGPQKAQGPEVRGGGIKQGGAVVSLNPLEKFRGCHCSTCPVATPTPTGTAS